MISIAIEYLTGVCRAETRHRRGEAEWPPHPDRLFMALVAGHHEMPAEPGSPEADEERVALEWVEAQPAPSLAASPVDRIARRSVETVYVPTNDDALSTKIAKIDTVGDDRLAEQLQVLPDRRGRKGRTFPAVVPSNPRVDFIWPHDPPPQVGRGLASLARKVTRLGHSASLVRAWLADDPPAPTLEPTDHDSDLRLRVPTAGRLTVLEQHFDRDSGSPPPIARSTAYRACRPSPPPSCRLAGSVIVLQRLDGVRAGLASAPQVCEILRQTLIKRCPQQPPPAWISGHEPDGSPSREDHIAIVPLPNVGNPHAKGHLLGLAVLVPAHVTDRERRRLLETAIASDREPLRLWGGDGGWFEWSVEPASGVLPQALRLDTWNGGKHGSRCWGSVTPVVLDRHARHATGLAESISDSCERAGLPRPLAISLLRGPAFVGVPPAWAFPPLRRGNGSTRRHLHAAIEFAEPVTGPIAIGAGRFAGYGLLRSLGREQAIDRRTREPSLALAPTPLPDADRPSEDDS